MLVGLDLTGLETPRGNRVFQPTTNLKEHEATIV
jgi:hypothetical protein